MVCVKCVGVKAIIMAGKHRIDIRNEVAIKTMITMFGISMFNKSLLNLRKCS